MYLQGLNFLRIKCKICPTGRSLSMSLSAPTILLFQNTAFPRETNGFKNFSIKSKDYWKKKSF